MTQLNTIILRFGLFIDFTKAFDTVCHNISLRNLKIYSICGTANEWFHNYLANRKLYMLCTITPHPN